MKSNPTKLALRSLFFHLIYCAVSWLFFAVFLSGIRNQMLIDEMFSTLRFTMFGFSTVTFLLYEFIVAFTYFKTAERKRDYLAYTEGGITKDKLQALRKLILKESLFTTLSVLLLQLPIAIFYTAFGYGYANALGFEKFFVGFIGFYQLAENAILGLGITLVIVFMYSYLARILSHNVWEKNRIRK
ncbi:MAG: hypothetical protein IJW90_06245 [Clostridia bacterium]|nr:hypothetical protein [Clostridia bacterium]